MPGSSLSQDGFQRRGLWVADITHYEVTTPLPLLTSKESFCACVVGGFLTSRMRNMWPFISYLGRAQPPPSSCTYHGDSVQRGETVQPRDHLSPVSGPSPKVEVLKARAQDIKSKALAPQGDTGS